MNLEAEITALAEFLRKKKDAAELAALQFEGAQAERLYGQALAFLHCAWIVEDILTKGCPVWDEEKAGAAAIVQRIREGAK